MKPLYRTAFQLERVGDRLNSVHEISQACLDWVFMYKGVPRKGIVRPVGLGTYAQDFAVTAIGDGRQVETRYWEGGTERLWALRQTYPDKKDSGIEWCVELTVQCTKDEVKFTCAQSIRRQDVKAGPLHRPAGQPGIIQQLITRYGARVGEIFQFKGEPLPLPADGFRCRLLLDLLLYQQRYPFVVLISPGRKGVPLVDAALWARKLSPLAFVFVAENDEATRAFEATLGSNRLACWGGAIRVYRPGFGLLDDPFKHYYYLPGEIQRKLAQYDEVGFVNLMVARMSKESCLQGQADFLFWSSWVEKVGHLRVQGLQQNNHEDAELATMYAEENAVIRENLFQSHQTINLLQDEVNSLKGWKEEAQRAHRAIREGTRPVLALRDLPEVDNLDEAIEVAQKELGDKIIFALNSKSDTDSPFGQPTDVLTAFRWLAGPFWESKAKRQAMGLPEESLKKVLPNWSYAGNQTATTLGRYAEWYRVDYSLPGGRKAYAEQHLKFGVGADPSNMIRIGFFWDDLKKLWVIGYIGPHQRNTKS